MDSIGSCLRDGPMDDISLSYQLPVGETSSFTRYLRSQQRAMIPGEAFNLHSETDTVFDHYSGYDLNQSVGCNTFSRGAMFVEPRDEISSYSTNKINGFHREFNTDPCYPKPLDDPYSMDRGYAMMDDRPQSTTASDSGSLRKLSTRAKGQLRKEFIGGKRTIRIVNLNRSVTPRDVEIVLMRMLPEVADSILGTFNHYKHGTIYMEFSTVEAAATVVEFFRGRSFPLGNGCLVEWSIRNGVVAAEEQIIKNNIKILSVNINHMLQIMNLHDLYYMLREFCQVEKIVLCNTVGITMATLIEFATPRDAFIAYRMFNNQNLIDGKCLVQINPSTNVKGLDVRTNNHKQWCFTQENQDVEAPSCKEVLRSLQQRLNDSFKRTVDGSIIRTTTAMFMRVLPPGSKDAVYRCQDIRRIMKELRLDDLIEANPGVTCVVKAKGFSRSVNSCVLFNVFSTCGNILRLKVLHSQDSIALIQYTEPIYAVLAALYLNKMPLLDNERKIKVELSHNREIFTGSDYCSYTSHDQRYQPKDEDKYLRSSCKPTTSIWIANIRLTENDIDTKTLMGTHGLHPLSCTVNKIQGDITSARVQFTNICEAVRAVAYMHDLGVEGGRLKVSFSRVKQ